MNHVAIMKKEWGFMEKILSGRKTIESRWYNTKYAPWDKIKKGEVVYFKNSGEGVAAKALVSNVLQFIDANAPVILKKYGRRIGIEKKDAGKFVRKFSGKKYCILIFLKTPRKIKPFEINKKGFGAMAAWVTIKDINTIKK